jgi:hypothetical protein
MPHIDAAIRKHHLCGGRALFRTLLSTVAQAAHVIDSNSGSFQQRLNGKFRHWLLLVLRQICRDRNQCPTDLVPLPVPSSPPAEPSANLVDEARRRIREALELFLDNARRAPIVDDVKLPISATRAIRAYATLRKKADEEDRRAARAARRAVRVLRTGMLKVSARDAARLLGLSHQRVCQLTQEEGTRPH